MPIRGTIISPPAHMTEETVRAAAKDLLAALKRMQAGASDAAPPEQGAQEPDAAEPPQEPDEDETPGDDEGATDEGVTG